MSKKIIPPYPHYPNFCLFGIIISVIIGLVCFIIITIKNKDDDKSKEEESKKQMSTPALILIISIIVTIIFASGCGIYYKTKVTEWIWNYGTTEQKTEYLGAQALDSIFRGINMISKP